MTKPTDLRDRIFRGFIHKPTGLVFPEYTLIEFRDMIPEDEIEIVDNTHKMRYEIEHSERRDVEA